LNPLFLQVSPSFGKSNWQGDCWIAADEESVPNQ
jgi:hypothetical protein